MNAQSIQPFVNMAVLVPITPDLSNAHVRQAGQDQYVNLILTNVALDIAKMQNIVLIRLGLTDVHVAVGSQVLTVPIQTNVKVEAFVKMVERA